MKRYKTLEEMTEQESGVIVYGDSDVIICNWATEGRNGGFPRLLSCFLIAMPDEEINLIRKEKGKVLDFLKNGLEFIYDANNDAQELIDSNRDCDAYFCDGDILVLAPVGWC